MLLSGEGLANLYPKMESALLANAQLFIELIA
jgi:hypothetical protein